MLTPIRSFTLAQGFWLSSFATTWATQPAVTLFSLTSGVSPINAVTSFAIFMVGLVPPGIGCSEFRPDLRRPQRTRLWSGTQVMFLWPNAVMPVAGDGLGVEGTITLFRPIQKRFIAYFSTGSHPD